MFTSNVVHAYLKRLKSLLECGYLYGHTLLKERSIILFRQNLNISETKEVKDTTVHVVVSHN